MSQGERETWLFGAFEHLAEHKIPAKPFADAVFKAKDLCDHPAKIVPTIIRESKKWTENLKRTERLKRKAYENENAPRLKQQNYEIPDDERAEVSEMLKQTTDSLKSATT